VYCRPFMHIQYANPLKIACVLCGQTRAKVFMNMHRGKKKDGKPLKSHKGADRRTYIVHRNTRDTVPKDSENWATYNNGAGHLFPVTKVFVTDSRRPAAVVINDEIY
jgi:hypothetical protein